MSFLIVYFLLITYLSAIICDPKPLTEKDVKDILKIEKKFKIGPYMLKLRENGQLGITNHSIVWKGELDGKTTVAVKINWEKEFSDREKKILNILNANDPEIETQGIPRIYHDGQIAPIFEEYYSIVMTLFDDDLEGRFNKQKKRMSPLSILMIFKRSLKILKYLNEQKIVHNDIKPKNIFFKGSEVFISDFDISTIETEQTIHATEKFASMNYFKNKSDPNWIPCRTSKDDLESLIYSMWWIADVSTDGFHSYGLFLCNIRDNDGSVNSEVSVICAKMVPSLRDIFERVFLRVIMDGAELDYGQIIGWVSEAISAANSGGSDPRGKLLKKSRIRENLKDFERIWKNLMRIE